MTKIRIADDGEAGGLQEHIVDSPQSNTSVDHALEPCIVEVQLAEAARLARIRHYAQAETVLDALQNAFGPLPVAATDLRARIRAQQGRYAEAEALWREALLADPQNDAYQAGLAFVTQRTRPAPFWGLAMTALAALAIVLAVVCFSLLWNRIGQMQSGLERVPQVNAPTVVVVVPTQQPRALPTAEVRVIQVTQLPDARPDQVNQSLGEIKSQVGALVSAQQTAAVPQTPVLPEMKLNVPGVQVDLQPEGKPQRVTLVFENGLFDYSWHFIPASHEALVALALQLELFATQVNITLVGFSTDRDDVTTPFDLGLARAIVVYNEMTGVARLAKDHFTILPQAGQVMPFPNSQPSGNFRNRTVVITITLR